MYNNDTSYLFTSFVPDETNQNIQFVRNELKIASYVGGTDPGDVITKNHGHITVKGAFSLKEGIQEDEIISRLEGIKFFPFDVQVTGYRFFHSNNLGNILVFLVEKNPHLLELHQTIHSLLEGSIYNKDTNFAGEKDNYIPHISAIYDIKEEDEEKGIELVRALLPFTYTFNKFLFLGNKRGVRHTRKLLKEIYATE